MLIYIVRHGETRSNTEGRLQGWTNDPLNENGRHLAVVTGQGMKGIHFDVCITSPLIRAKETAELILRESGNDVPITIDDRLKEINMGEWEGKRFRPGESEVDEEECKLFLYDAFKFSGCPGGESIRELCIRTQDFLKELLEIDDDRTYLITTHGTALRAMLNWLYDDPSSFWQEHVPYNCAVSTIVKTKDGVKLIAKDHIYYSESEAVDQYAIV